MWAVAVPVAVVEHDRRHGLVGRSRALTRDRRWRIFGTVLVAGLILASLKACSSEQSDHPHQEHGRAASIEGLTELGHPSRTVALAVTQWAFNALDLAFYACLLATLYYYLRRDKEGVDIEQIAAVFD